MGSALTTTDLAEVLAGTQIPALPTSTLALLELSRILPMVRFSMRVLSKRTWGCWVKSCGLLTHRILASPVKSPAYPKQSNWLVFEPLRTLLFGARL